VLISLPQTIEPIGGYTTVCDSQLARRQTYGYLPGRRALPLLLSRYSYLFPVLLKVGGWVGLSGWLHTTTVYPRTVTRLST